MELNHQWNACVEAFLRSFSPSDSAASTANYRSTLGIFFRGLQRDPAHTTRADVERFIFLPTVQGRKPAPGTRNMRLSVVASFYTYASEYVPDDQYAPLYTGKLPTTGIKRSTRDIAYRGMTTEEVQRFFSVIPSDSLIGLRDRAVFITLYLTARRLREVLDLCYGDILWETIIDGKERREAWVYKFRNKGRKGQVDTAELGQLAKDAIDDYLLASGRLPLAPDDPIFVASVDRVDRDPYSPLWSTTVRFRFKLYCEYAGLDSRRLSPHALRHASAQHRVANGASVLEVSRALRHRSLDTTQRYISGLLSEADPGLGKLEDRLKDT